MILGTLLAILIVPAYVFGAKGPKVTEKVSWVPQNTS